MRRYLEIALNKTTGSNKLLWCCLSPYSLFPNMNSKAYLHDNKRQAQ